MAFKVFDTAKTKITAKGPAPKVIRLRDNGILYFSKHILTDLGVTEKFENVIPMYDEDSKQIGLLFTEGQRQASITVTFYKDTAQIYLKKLVDAYKLKTVTDWEYTKGEWKEPGLFWILTMREEEEGEVDAFAALGATTESAPGIPVETA